MPRGVGGDRRAGRVHLAERVAVGNAAGLVDSHFVDRLVKPGVEYTYWVTATDTGTRESAASAKVMGSP